MTAIINKTNTGELNFKWAYTLIHYFSLMGVTQAVISPGSRSTPLALACEKHPEIETYLHIDERSAAFYALGLSQKALSQKSQPTILICTSGSALANWFPAVVEAKHAYRPLLLLSADRPIELQNCGANQTIDQHNFFGSQVADFIALEHADLDLLNNDYLLNITKQAYEKSLSPKPGAVHLNIPLREPLLPQAKNKDINTIIKQLCDDIHSLKLSPKNKITDLTQLPLEQIKKLSIANTLSSDQGIIICGQLTSNEKSGLSELLPLFLKKLNCPILLDPLSNLRFNTSIQKYAIYNYDHFLQHELSHPQIKPKWIIRLGTFPVSKNLMYFLKQLNTTTLLINSFGDKLDPIKTANIFLNLSPKNFCSMLIDLPLKPKPLIWLKQWKQLEQQSEIKINNELENSKQLFEGHVINSLLKNIPNKSLLFSGNSMAIRDFDTFLTHSLTHGKDIDFYANRGVSGIDGNLSSFLGLLTNHKSYGVIMLGDVSFYHDMNSLITCKKLAQKGYNATILLINNSGGGIFNYLPQQQLNEFDKLWNTDTQLDFQHSAKLYDLHYSKIENRKELEEKLPKAMRQPGFQLVEIIINQQISVECHKQIKANNKNDLE